MYDHMLVLETSMQGQAQEITKKNWKRWFKRFNDGSNIFLAIRKKTTGNLSYVEMNDHI